MTISARKQPEQACVRVPATCANLGPGFDALGLALDLCSEVRATWRTGYGEATLEVQGFGAGELPTDATNLIARAYQDTAKALGEKAPSVHLHCTNRIPLARGLGSSSSALVAGGLLAYAALGLEVDPQRLLRIL
ncbi:MAG: GHMP family kinase ATP-binding protein, partial [Planctomycetota bacterium]